MSAGVSDNEICNLAYDGQMALLAYKIKENPGAVNVKDQVTKPSSPSLLAYGACLEQDKMDKLTSALVK